MGRGIYSPILAQSGEAGCIHRSGGFDQVSISRRELSESLHTGKTSGIVQTIYRRALMRRAKSHVETGDLKEFFIILKPECYTMQLAGIIWRKEKSIWTFLVSLQSILH